jgi:putative molybdopterin biosynthesis protein
LERTLFFSGSHDLTLDILSAALYRQNIRVVCTNVGSLSGLMALRRREAHAIGSHLLDPQTGEYNTAYIQQYLAEVPVAVVRWVGREQGLIVRKGNPERITSLMDLTRQGIRYINRQRGAGTRVLLDYHLAKLGISPAQVNGYGLEEYTHLAVAAAVVSGRADCGLGITSAARALDCGFIPLFHEDYELIIPDEYLQLDMVKLLLDLAGTPDFREKVKRLDGYRVEQMGEIRTRIAE